MLFDPKWTGTYTLIDLIAWLETKDPEETYNFVNPATCAVAQWTGKTNLCATLSNAGQSLQSMDDATLISIDSATFPGCEWIVRGGDASWKGDWTFGAALKRARLLLDATQK